MPAGAAEAALPSTVDVYVNHLLQIHTDVSAGTFTINNLPVMTGQSDARIVVSDLLGQEQIISQPYYVSPQLLSACFKSLNNQFSSRPSIKFIIAM